MNEKERDRMRERNTEREGKDRTWTHVMKREMEILGELYFSPF